MTGMSVLSFLFFFRSYIFEKHVCVKDSSAEGTCNIIKEP